METFEGEESCEGCRLWTARCCLAEPENRPAPLLLGNPQVLRLGTHVWLLIKPQSRLGLAKVSRSLVSESSFEWTWLFKARKQMSESKSRPSPASPVSKRDPQDLRGGGFGETVSGGVIRLREVTGPALTLPARVLTGEAGSQTRAEGDRVRTRGEDGISEPQEGRPVTP